MKARRLLFAVFLLWPFGFGMVGAGIVPFAFGDTGAARVLAVAFITGGILLNGLWAYYAGKSGLAGRAHECLGLTRDPFTGKYGATQRDIAARARKQQGAVPDQRKEG